MAKAATAAQEQEKAPGFQIRVRALLRGHDGLVIRNADEVFYLDANGLPALEKGATVPIDAETKKPRQTAKGPDGVVYVIPRWCALIGAKERVAPEDEVSKGHKTAFRPGDDNVI